MNADDPTPLSPPLIEQLTLAPPTCRTHVYGDLWNAQAVKEMLAEEHERFVELRKAARFFYNATIATPGLRLSSHSEELRDIAKAAGGNLRTLLLASGSNH